MSTWRAMMRGRETAWLRPDAEAVPAGEVVRRAFDRERGPSVGHATLGFLWDPGLAFCGTLAWAFCVNPGLGFLVTHPGPSMLTLARAFL